MELGVVLMIVFALVLAVVAGLGAARFLMHASEARSTQGGQSNDG
jgi:hypothetical protein